nr:stress response protein nst1-like [Aegilops tauschii subsp. strangulata]
MLVPAPYEAPEKKVREKGKEAKDGFRCKGTSDGVSRENETHSSEEDEDEEEEEENEEDEADRTLSPKGKKKKKRAASEEPEAEASLLAATAQAAKVSELKRQLGLADENLVRINKGFDEAQGSAAAVEALRGELAQAQEQARVNKVAAEKVAEDLKSEQVIRCQYEERIAEVEKALKDASDKYKSLEEKSKAHETGLAEALKEAEEARTESQAAREEIKQARQVAADVLVDLPESAADAARFFQAQEGHAMEKQFWSQFVARECPALLNDQMSQWAELHRMSDAAMRDVIVRLWPTEPVPSSYFGLVRRLVDALPRINAVKRSSCIEGARLAFAHVKMHSAKMKAASVAVEGPPRDKVHRTPERYFEDVLEGARLIEGQCSKDILFE